MPEMVEGTELWHPLGAEVAADLGLSSGTPVVLGYVDVACTALGAGLFDEAGEIGCSIIGSTAMHMRLARSAGDVDLSGEPTGYTMCFPVPGFYARMQSNLAATLNIDWLLDLGLDVLAAQGVQSTRRDLLTGLDDRVLVAAPASAIYFPYISEAGERGPFIDANARAGFVGLSSQHRYASLMRSVYEGLALAAADCYGAMGGAPGEVRLTGGAARSRAIRTILSGALGAAVRTSSRDEAGAAGAAMMAAVSIGAYRDMSACAATWVAPTLGDAVPPDPELRRLYAGLYPIYAETRRALQPTWRALRTIEGGPVVRT